ncbi:hypothetical protein OE88DRAFT_491168 [Heliocybe sulcata]|uniref:Uncharacterized protein n=1 Tax=Heliocybe sulcata TaxID=5364 RepID=A0A5C3MUH6_9AGAM|nr:hypothetical protein OE88DRAFT_491168 [Heliocybe sulcata]
MNWLTTWYSIALWRSCSPNVSNLAVSSHRPSPEAGDILSLVQETAESQATTVELGAYDLLWDNEDATMHSESPVDLAAGAPHDVDNVKSRWSDEEEVFSSQDSLPHEEAMLEDAELEEASQYNVVHGGDNELWEDDSFESPVSSQESSDSSQGSLSSDPLQGLEHVFVLEETSLSDPTGNKSAFVHTPALNISFINDWLPGGIALEGPGKETPPEGVLMCKEDHQEGSLSTLFHVPFSSDEQQRAEMIGFPHLDQGYAQEVAFPAPRSGYGELFDDISFDHEPHGHQETELGMACPGNANYEGYTVPGSPGIQSAVRLARRNPDFPGSPPAFISCFAPGDLAIDQGLNVDDDDVLDF